MCWFSLVYEEVSLKLIPSFFFKAWITWNMFSILGLPDGANMRCKLLLDLSTSFANPSKPIVEFTRSRRSALPTAVSPSRKALWTVSAPNFRVLLPSYWTTDKLLASSGCRLLRQLQFQLKFFLNRSESFASLLDGAVVVWSLIFSGSPHSLRISSIFLCCTPNFAARQGVSLK